MILANAKTHFPQFAGWQRQVYLWILTHIDMSLVQNSDWNFQDDVQIVLQEKHSARIFIQGCICTVKKKWFETILKVLKCQLYKVSLLWLSYYEIAVVIVPLPCSFDFTSHLFLFNLHCLGSQLYLKYREEKKRKKTLQGIWKSVREIFMPFPFVLTVNKAIYSLWAFFAFRQINTFCHNSIIKLLQSLRLFLPALEYTSYLYLNQ